MFSQSQGRGHAQLRILTMIDKAARFPARRPGVAGRLGLLLAAAWLATGCHGRDATDSTAAPRPATGRRTAAKPAAPLVTNYTLEGVVRSVAPKSGEVVIRHRAIPGFMPAMAMVFKPVNREVLETLHPGDAVEGTLRVEKADGAVKDYQLLDLKVTRPAEPPAKVLDVSKGKVQLRQQVPRLQVGDPVPDFTMTGQDGHPFKLSDLRGKVIVLTFIYTRCPMPDFCPLMDRKFSDLSQHLSAFPNRAKEIRLISVSFDPEHDTPEVLRKHAQIRGAVPPLWSYAVASHPELTKIAAPLGLFFGPDGTDIAHNLATAVIDPRGNLARLEVGTQANRWETSDFLKTIYSLLSPAVR
jgi:protein SCO1/2